jgi:predicted TIM-barrel fold metal-dependent hydrolase
LDFSRFADMDVIDGHIHFRHFRRVAGLLTLVEGVPYARVHALSMPNRKRINDNPAVIWLKALHPDRAFISAGLDYGEAFADLKHASENLASQVKMLKSVGFDGLKMYASSPKSRKWLQVPLDAPAYEGLWATLEELEIPVLSHVAQPEAFWDPVRVPDWASRSMEGGYLDDSFPSKETLYTEMDRVLDQHPSLRLVLAHFYFLSADLERAGRFLEAHPSVRFDLTPGLEMLNNLSSNRDEAREFFMTYQDRLIYGTDITSADLALGDEEGLKTSLAKAWVVRAFLENEGSFLPPEEIGFWLYPRTDRFRGLALPHDVLSKIYRTNFERLYGAKPVPLNREAAIVELGRLAAAYAEKVDDPESENQARRVADQLRRNAY